MFRTRELLVLLAGLTLAVSASGTPNPPGQVQASPEPAWNSEAQEEVSGTWQGRIDVLVEDNFQTGTSRRRLFLHTSDETLELQAVEGGALRAGHVVEVAGRASGKRLMVSQATTLSTTTVTAPSCSATGQQKAVVILASFPSKALLSSVTPALVRASFFGTGRTLNQFVVESSYSHASITGAVLGPYVLDADYFDQPLAVRDAALRAAAPHANLLQYNRIFVVAPQGQTGMDSGGMALLGCGQISSPQGNLNASSIWMGAESMVSQNAIVDIASHELGHGFGLEHARFADYGADVLGPAGQAAAPWDGIHEYGDSFSSMGRKSAQWGAPQKALLGWLPPTNIKTVTSAGTFSLLPYESSGSGQVLKVSRGGNNWLWLEYRRPQGIFDATLPATSFNGALAHYTDPALTATLPGVDPATYTNLVDFHPTPPYANDPLLHAGQTWRDSYGTLSLTVNSATASALSVTVAYAAVPTCPSSAGAAQSFSSAGGAGALTVTAPKTCSWKAASSASWMSVGSGGSGTGNGSVKFTVAQNPNVSPRWARITVGGAFAIVTQAGSSSGWMTISPLADSFSAAGGVGEISVATSSADLAWSMGWTAPWITDVECSCFLDKGPATVRYIVAMNTGPARTAAINFGSQSFTISQQAGAGTPGITFTPLAPPNAPTARLGQAMAPFGHSGQAVLYGGAWDGNFAAGTWLWDGSNWTLLNPANNPGLVAEHAMAYDDAHGKIVLFGGVDGTTYAFRNQTWVWDGQNWQQMQPPTSPPARYNHAMAYDSVLGKIVLFGGYGENGDLNDTWTWDGANWTEVNGSVNPIARSGHAMAFDARHGEIVLFGGFHSEGPPTWFSDTWLWDAKGWRLAPSGIPPAARSGHVLAYDPALQSVVMIGGAGGKDVTDTTWNYDFRRETWTWNGSSWTQQFPPNQPGAAYTVVAVYDDARQALTVHVGDDLTCASRGPKTLHLVAASAGTTSVR